VGGKGVGGWPDGKGVGGRPSAKDLAGKDLAGKKEPEDKDPGPSRGKYATPRDTFATYAAATKRKDVKGMMDCYTPESRRLLAGYMGSLCVALRREFDKNNNAPQMPFSAVLDKHGLTPDATRNVQADLKQQAPAKLEMEKQGKQVLALVKNPDALLVDLLVALADMDTKGGFYEAPGTLQDVQIRGNSATARVVGGKGVDLGDPRPGGGPNNTRYFLKVGGNWLMDANQDK